MHASLNEMFTQLSDEHTQQIISNLLTTQAAVLAKFAISETSKKAARTNAEEAFKGTYDAVEQKWKEWFKHLPLSNILLPAGSALVGSLALGLLLTLWRFALFGLK